MNIGGHFQNRYKWKVNGDIVQGELSRDMGVCEIDPVWGSLESPWNSEIETTRVVAREYYHIQALFEEWDLM